MKIKPIVAYAIHLAVMLLILWGCVGCATLEYTNPETGETLKWVRYGQFSMEGADVVLSSGAGATFTGTQSDQSKLIEAGIKVGIAIGAGQAVMP